jgi:hypothetical protein
MGESTVYRKSVEKAAVLHRPDSRGPLNFRWWP